MIMQYIINDRLNNIKILMVKIFAINKLHKFYIKYIFFMMFKEGSFQFDIDIIKIMFLDDY